MVCHTQIAPLKEQLAAAADRQAEELTPALRTAAPDSRSDAAAHLADVAREADDEDGQQANVDRGEWVRVSHQRWDWAELADVRMWRCGGGTAPQFREFNPGRSWEELIS